jgi:phenylacetate-coenzyme A ligase PaaK-like adenylate-forming protein
METNPLSAFLGAASPWEWLRAADDLWRWGAYAHEIRAYDRADEATRAAIRQRRVASMIEHARSASAFYREHYRQVAPGSIELAAYPPVTRKMLMARFDDWVTDTRLKKAELLSFVADPARIADPWLGKYTVWTSSGTTGVPGVYVQDPDAIAVYTALVTSRFELGGDTAALPGSGSGRLAFVAAIDGHFAGIVSWERQRRLYPPIALAARAFSILQPLPDLVAQLNEWQPDFISSYPTMMTLLAGERRAGRLAVSPHGLWCGGEGLAPSDRADIEEAFGCRIVEDYGASECMNMAFGCGHGRLHLNDDWVVLEPVDENHRPVPAGEPSATVLVTNLANRVQPLIRYDLGDSVSLDTTMCPCGCSRPSLRVEGRGDDMLVLEPVHAARGARGGGRDAVVRILPLAVETVIEEETDIHLFQLTQTAPDILCLRLDADGEHARASAFRRVKAALSRFLQQQGAAPVRIELDPLPPECNPVSGKFRRVRVLPGAHCRS